MNKILLVAVLVLAGCQQSQPEASAEAKKTTSSDAAAITIVQSKEGKGNHNSVELGGGASTVTVIQSDDGAVSVRRPEGAAVHVTQTTSGDNKTSAVSITGTEPGGGISIKQSSNGNGNVNSVTIQ
ncbi:hypothetical protein [Pandoraea sp. ISTKB]|uniref:hypothetical protein n=1 Tax=Pandoraea sp. ISTKB TaxID=1586708 RepID=UPI0008474CCC|nr:hypothetical protein [Pandoraea sp. ISTKB]ODP35134.1 hypothetical protein A9762_12320 [Pandoraea sp. ISTKB]